MRRKPGSLVPLEIAICSAAATLRRQGVSEFHGYEMARTLGDAADTRLLTAYGTLYRALGRLEQMGMMTSAWEDPQIPADANRPRRRLYAITPDGQTAVANATRESAAAPLAIPRISTT